MTTSNKLNKILQTKNAIKESIYNLGIEITDEDIFSSYPTKLSDFTTQISALLFAINGEEPPQLDFDTHRRINNEEIILKVNGVETIPMSLSIIESMGSSYYQGTALDGLPIVMTYYCGPSNTTIYVTWRDIVKPDTAGYWLDNSYYEDDEHSINIATLQVDWENRTLKVEGVEENLVIDEGPTYASLTFDNCYFWSTAGTISALNLNVAEVIDGVEQTPVSYAGTYSTQTKELIDVNGDNIYTGSSIDFGQILEVGKTYKISVNSYKASPSYAGGWHVFDDSAIPTRGVNHFNNITVGNLVYYTDNTNFTYTETITVEKDVVRYVGGSMDPI